MAGWRQAYDELVTARYPSLLAYASLVTGSTEEAQSVTRSALVRVFGRLRPPSTLAAAEVAARREIVARATTRRRRRATMPSATAPQPEPDEVDAATRERVEARERLRALDPLTRACVVLRHADELPLAEVAAELRLSTDDVRARLARAGDPTGEWLDAEAAAEDIMIVEVRGARRRA